ncbi:hypothetical protein GPECTOR_35g875 [Gonium pectorale]|uniref:Uncharacterized protein n=1 Tax=Gonium pectorale TaxID=33097 RepID=A0A150GC59_GONPE|nr:hypothetical protein GPECTOR_35g875 [Gonium pectorale]|eukprot:KXZ47437.1 hypothetical protein GPECTOR_35g875 [Gonium pectorale]
MAAFVERTRVEEEAIRRKREEVELQLLRMRQQEAVRRQQALRMRVATEQANAAVLQQTQQTQPQPQVASEQAASEQGEAESPGPSQPGDLASAVASTGPGGVAGSADGPGGMVGGGAGPVKKKLVLKRSKRMSAVAAAAGLNRASPAAHGGGGPSSAGPLGGGASPSGGFGGPSGSLAAAAAAAGRSALPASGSGSGGAKAMLSRGEMIKNNKGGRDGGGAAEAAAAAGGGSDSECALEEVVVVPKPIFVISDCTGESAARTVRAALNQFEMRCRTQAPAQIMIFRFVESVDKVLGIIQEAAKAIQTACKLAGVRYVDLWSTLLDTMEVHLNAVRRQEGAEGRGGVPASLAEARQPKVSLNDEYFRMIEAVEYTRKMDDGAHPQEWAAADLVILGVSRCGKTPLSIYLGQRGYKVANLPLIAGCPVPKELFTIDQSRIVGLIIDPHVLASIRRNRVSMMGVARAQGIDYAEIQKINSELEWARQLYNAHPDWPVLDVTLRGIEETAARILKMLNDRRGDASPKWVEAFHAKQAAAAARSAAVAAAGSGGGGVAGGGGPLTSADTGPGYGIPELIYGANESSYLMQGLY